MRAARLVGPSPDGRYVIVATDSGEELAIAADDRLRAAVRGRPAASEKLETDMESALSPREIQTRIRSGESVEDVARVAGVDRERVERFAAPVIAEREHVAGLALTSSARRRGETSTHRTLRSALNDRLLSRGVDIDTVSWDSYRIEDGRWAVTADYQSGETPRQALFFFDLPGRYSVSGNDEGRWVLGDVSPNGGPQPGRGPGVPGEAEGDTEPTIDLSDELALVRAIQDAAPAPDSDLGIAEVVQLSRRSEAPAEDPGPEEATAAPASAESEDLDDELSEIEDELDRLEREESGLDALYEIFEEQDPRTTPAETDDPEVGFDREATEPTVQVERPVADGEPAIEEHPNPREDVGPSDASAVPELSPSLRSDAWEPAIVVDYPVEPSEDSGGIEVPEGSDEPGRPEAPVAGDDRRQEAASLVDVTLFGEPEPLPESGPVAPEPKAPAEPEPAKPVRSRPAAARSEPEDQPLPLDLPEQPAAPKPARRKRASVPSWDEIVFGGPKDK